MGSSSFPGAGLRLTGLTSVERGGIFDTVPGNVSGVTEGDSRKGIASLASAAVSVSVEAGCTLRFSL